MNRGVLNGALIIVPTLAGNQESIFPAILIGSPEAPSDFSSSLNH
jgi:hypothetical protein